MLYHINMSDFILGDALDDSMRLINAGAIGSNGWIRSRVNEDLRSSCTLRFKRAEFGIASSFALAAWKQGSANLGDSDLILEGGDE